MREGGTDGGMDGGRTEGRKGRGRGIQVGRESRWGGVQEWN